jgi:hypothetical protein
MAKVIMMEDVSVECNIAFTNSYQITEPGPDLGGQRRTPLGNM